MGAAAAAGVDPKVVKRVKMLNNANKGSSKGGVMVKNSVKIRQMTEVEEDQMMEESPNIQMQAQAQQTGPFSKFSGTYDESRKPNNRIQLLDKFSKSLQNFERPEQLNNNSSLTDEEADNNDQIYYQDKERASMPVASSVKPLMQQEYVGDQSTTQTGEKSESVFDRIGQLITKLWAGEEEEEAGEEQMASNAAM